MRRARARFAAVAIGLAAGACVSWLALLAAGVDVGWAVARFRYRLIPPPPTGIYRESTLASA